MSKSILLAFTLLAGVALGQDPVIMSINGNEITKSEFLQIYLKNNDDPKYDKASLDEYMELFKKFKLKVAEAENLGYDTIPKLMNELKGYRKQLARPYLIDSSRNEALVQEAYTRMKSEIRASHILVRLNEGASPEDTLKAYNRLLELREMVMSGTDFALVAKGKNGSEDPSVRDNGGDLGYFTAFQMVYPFENVAYNTKIGEVSMPFRTQFGYHIIQVNDIRPARGTIEAAHIFIAIAKGTGEDGAKAAEDRINELYAQLENGADFEGLVAKHSDDPSSNQKGGKLPLFGTNTTTRMVPEFSKAAFELKTDGEYSQPVRTTYGWHIIKRVSWKDLAPFADLEKELQNRVSRDERSVVTQKSFVNKLKSEYGYKVKKSGRKWFYKNMDSTYYLGQFKAENAKKGKKVLFKMDGKKFRAAEFASFLESSFRGAKKEQTIEALVDRSYGKWEEQAILDYEETKLPGKFPAYKALITEYHDGILLYEVMSDKVWNKAMKDTAGLRSYYNSHRGDYQWGERIEGEIFECLNADVAKKTRDLLLVDTLTSTTVVRMVNEESALNVKPRYGKFEIEKTPYINIEGVQLKAGELSENYQHNGKYYVVNTRNVLAASPKKFDEAKGAITSDFQSHLEAEWLKEISGKHTIVVHEEVLYSLGK